MLLISPLIAHIKKIVYSNNVIWNIKCKDDQKTIYITFDDGPTAEITDWVLNTLKRFKARATFFCVGENIKDNQELFSKIIKENHSIGNHTYSHINGWRYTKNNYIENIKKFERECYKTNLFRPPFGKLTPKQIKAINQNHYIIMWSVLSADFDKNTSKENCLKNVLKNTKAGSIINFHDNDIAKENLIYTLPRILEYFTEKGYKFDKIVFPNK